MGTPTAFRNWRSVWLEKLFVRPAAQEGGGLRVFDRTSVENGAQVDDGVRLDIRHVGQRPHLLVAEGIAGRLAQVEVADIDLLG
jgi:hypothetical protein